MKRLPSVLRDRPQLRQRRHHARSRFPVVPTIHYQMGGIPTNIHGQVVAPKDGNPNARRQRPLRGRRMRLRQRARRQPARHQLAARPAGVRPRGRQPHRRVSAASSKAHKPLPADAADCALARLARLDGSDRRRVRAGRRQRHPRDDAAARRRVPHAGVAGRGRAARSMALRRARRSASRLKDKSQGLQHRARRGAGGREPDRVRAGHDRLGRGAQGMPRRAHGRATTSARPTTRVPRSAATTPTG